MYGAYMRTYLHICTHIGFWFKPYFWSLVGVGFFFRLTKIEELEALLIVGLQIAAVAEPKFHALLSLRGTETPEEKGNAQEALLLHRN